MFALVDCNSFYCSCERVFRPDLAAMPVVVLSNNDGCIISLTTEAKKLGLQMGFPFFQVKNTLKEQGVAVFSSNYTLYGDFSARVLATLQPFAQEIENYSIDESFLRFSPGPKWSALGREIRRTVLRHTGIPVSVGFGPTKVLAKLANKIAKRAPELGGVFLMPDATTARDEILAKWNVGDLWGIGSQLSTRLAAAGVTTALELSRMNDAAAKRLLTIVGLRIVWELRGRSCLEIEDVTPPKKNLVCSRSFGAAITTKDEMDQAVATYALRAGEKLRRQNSVTGHLRVFLETNPFNAAEAQYFGSAPCVLDTPSNYSPDLVSAAVRALNRCWRDGFRYKKAGVMCFDLHSSSAVQTAFSSPSRDEVERRRRAMAAVDFLNQRLGRGAVTIGTAARPSGWQMRRSMCSPHYTTRWQDLAVAAA